MAILWTAVILVIVALACAISCTAVLRLTLGRPYPTFLAMQRWPEFGAIPVIMYHGVTLKYFGRDLRYLKCNGYDTVSADTLIAWLNGEPVSLPNKPIVLTFDDGLKSLWTVCFPCLKEFGYQGIAFVCPHRIDFPPQFCQAGEGLTVQREGIVTWDELREMDASGIIDVQSHTYDHHRMWVDSLVVDFFKPGQYLPFVRWDDETAPAGHPLPPLGWPILPHCQRFAHRRRFLPDQTVLQACANHVAVRGGPALFDRHSWSAELRAFLLRRGTEWHVPGRWETAEERVDALRDDLKQSKRLIEQHLGKIVEHLAFPRNEASTLATSLAAEVGYRSVFRGSINESDVCKLGDDPMCIPRVNAGVAPACHVLSLPGRKRRMPERLFAARACVAARCSIQRWTTARRKT